MKVYRTEEFCGIPILLVSYCEVKNFSTGSYKCDSSFLSWCPHVEGSTPTSHARTLDNVCHAEKRTKHSSNTQLRLVRFSA